MGENSEDGGEKRVAAHGGEEEALGFRFGRRGRAKKEGRGGNRSTWWGTPWPRWKGGGVRLVRPYGEES